MERSLTGRLGASVVHWALLVVQVAMAGALFALLLVIAERHNRRFDLTPTQSFVLSDGARRVAEGVRVPIRITVFYNSQEHGQRRQMEDLLQLFGGAAPKITYRLRDLDRSPALAKKYGITSFNTGVMESDGQVRELRTIDQEEITNALLKLTRRGERRLCFFTGHGEHSPQDSADRTGYSEVAKALEKENFDIDTRDVIRPEGVPHGCTVVILAGPKKEWLPGEADQLSHYLDAGGHILLMVDPDASQSAVQFLARYNVRAGSDIIVDERNRFYGADSFMPRVPIFDEGTFRKNLDTAAVFSLARTVAPMQEKQTGVSVLLVALSSPESFAHLDGGTIPEGDVHFRREVDKPGPLPVGVMVTGERPAGGPGAGNAAEPLPPTPAGGDTGTPTIGRMIVFGDSDFASNLYLNLLGNKDLFMSSVGVLAEDPELIAMRRKGLPRGSLSPVSLTAQQGRLIFWVAVIAVPAGFASLGMLITARRRRRASL